MFKFKHSKINSGKICKLSGYFFGQQTDKRGVTQINNLLFILTLRHKQKRTNIFHDQRSAHQFNYSVREKFHNNK